MSLKCQKTQRLLSDYIDATLSKRQMEDVTEHLNTCRTCKREAIDLKKTCHLLENFYVEPEASDTYYTQFTKTLQQRIEQSAPTALHQRVYGTSSRLTWQLTARVRRHIDRCLPTGHISIRQKMLPYYTLVAAMMALLVAPFALKFVPSDNNGEHTLPVVAPAWPRHSRSSRTRPQRNPLKSDEMSVETEQPKHPQSIPTRMFGNLPTNRHRKDIS